MTVTGHGIEMLDLAGIATVRVRESTSQLYDFSSRFGSDGLEDLWLVENGGVARVNWNLRGHERTGGTGWARIIHAWHVDALMWRYCR